MSSSIPDNISSTNSNKGGSSSFAKPPRIVNKRCGHCDACRRSDCGKCFECVRKKKFGGDGSSKQACWERRCEVLAEMKKERKRHRATSGGSRPNSDDDEDYSMDNYYGSGSRRRKKPRRASGGGSSAPNNDEDDEEEEEEEEEELDPMVLQLREAFPTPPSSLLADGVVHKATVKSSSGAGSANGSKTKKKVVDERIANLGDYKYGLKVLDPIRDICAGCRQEKSPRSRGGNGGEDGMMVEDDDEDGKQVILLCDGPNCQSEYHLECCLPPITEVPEGNYYCVDCNVSGTTAVLETYLEEHDERRARKSSAHNPFGFLATLWKEDLLENQDNWTEEKDESGSAANPDLRVPQSELSRLLDVQYHLVNSGSGSSGTTMGAGGEGVHQACSYKELCDLLLGKPIRLYCPLDDNYHSGRIVNYRPITPIYYKKISSSSSGGSASGSKKSSRATMGKTNPDQLHYIPNDDFFANQVEFLVRFVPGSDEHRKTMVHHWIRLEEHSLAVGTHMVWGKFSVSNQPGSSPKKGVPTPTTPVATPDKAQSAASPHRGSVGAATTPVTPWQPAILFLRTSRELMPVLHLLQEEEGEIDYHPPNLMKSMTTGSSGSSRGSKKGSGFALSPGIVSASTTIPRRNPKKMWALAKRLGTTVSPNKEEAKVKSSKVARDEEDAGDSKSETYKLLCIDNETRDLFDRKPGPSHIDQLKHSLAMAEYNEQMAVVHWKHALPLHHKMGPKALQSQDEHRLGVVEFQNYPGRKKNQQLSEEERELCPLIRPPGLDRAYLMDRLVQRGLVAEATKDSAAELECWLLP